MIVAEFEEMGVGHLAVGAARKLGAGDEEEGEGVGAGEEGSVKELGVEREALGMRAVRGVGLDELVVEEKSWVGNSVEHLVCIVYVADF